MGYAVSNFGSAMASIALAFAVLDSGGGAVDLGYVFASGVVPQVVLMLGGGVIADRLGRRGVMLAADALRTASQGILVGLLLVGHPPIWVFCGLAGSVGVGDAFFSPGLSGLTVELVPADELGDANAMFAMARSVASVAGPAVAGVVVAVANPAAVITLDAVSYALSACALSGLRLPELSSVAGRSMLSDLGAGWGEFASRTWLWVTTLQFGLFNLVAWGPFLLLGGISTRTAPVSRPVLCWESVRVTARSGELRPSASSGPGPGASGACAVARTRRR